MPSVGLLTIGQCPRPDLTAPLRELRPDVNFVEAGALDPFSVEELPASTGAYPLTTRLRSGETVTIDQATLEPLLQQALDRLERQAIGASMLLCAGTFGGLYGKRPLYKPFDLVDGLLRSAGISSIGVLCPFAGQEAAICERWLAKGYRVNVGTATLDDESRVDALLAQWRAPASPIDAVILDYVGHDPALVRSLQARHDIAIYDLGLTTMTVLGHTVPSATASLMAG